MVTPESATPEIVLVVECDALRNRLLGALSDCGNIRDVHALGRDDTVDLLVTDSSSQTLGELLPCQQDGPHDLGIVRIGHGTADVVLPGDFSERELTTACRLLSEIVRLRRGHQSAIRSRRVYQQLALTDALTGLANRRAWDQELSDRLSGGETPHGPRRGLCLVLIDLDHFASVNTTHGHVAGDEVLKSTADALRSSVRDDDFVARLGGDEFSLLAYTADRSAAVRLCNRLRSEIVEILAQRAVCPVTVSVGGAWSAGGDAADATALYADASEALRQAKDAGRNLTVFV